MAICILILMQSINSLIVHVVRFRSRFTLTHESQWLKGPSHLSHVFRILQLDAYRLHTHSTTIVASLALYNSMLLDAYRLGCVTLSPPPTPSPLLTPHEECVNSKTRVQATWKWLVLTLAMTSGKSADRSPCCEYIDRREDCKFSGE